MSDNSDSGLGGLLSLAFGVLGMVVAGKNIHRGVMDLRGLNPDGSPKDGQIAGLKGVKSGAAKRGLRGADVPIGKLETVYTLKQRIDHIKEMIDVGVRGKEATLLWQIVKSELGARCGKDWCTPERDWKGEVEAIYDFARANVRYTHDNRDVDTFQSPIRTLQVHVGDCDDVSILLAAMLKHAGYPVKLRVIRTKDSSDWDHIYVLAGVPPTNPRQWVPLDASLPKAAGWEAPADLIAAKKDFEV